MIPIDIQVYTYFQILENEFHIFIHVNLPTGGWILQFFLGHLPFSNILPYSPDFNMFLPYSPDFYMFTSRMCNLHHVHLGQGNKMQFEWHTSWYLW